MIDPCFVSKVNFSALFWVPTSKAKVPEDDAQLRISVKKYSEITC